MKKVLTVMLTVLFVGLAGCNQADNTSATAQTTTEEKTTAQTTTQIPTSVVPTTQTPVETSNTKEYTAEELSEKTVPEIIDIMDGEFNFDKSKGVIWYSDGGFYIYNDKKLPGFVFYIDNAQADYQKLKETDGEEKANLQMRENLKSGKYPTLSFIAMYDAAKLNDSISADMNYQQFINAYGYAPTGAIPPSERVGHILRYDKGRIKTVQVYYEYSGTKRNSVEKEDDDEMNQINPDIFAIVALPQELAIPEYKESAETDSGYEKYLGSWGNTNQIGRGYTVVISAVNGNQIECSMSLAGSVGHIATVSKSSLSIEDNVANFDFTDSWTNTGNGALTFDGDTIFLEAEITERGSQGYGFMTVDKIELTKLSDSTSDPFE